MCSVCVCVIVFLLCCHEAGVKGGMEERRKCSCIHVRTRVCTNTCMHEHNLTLTINNDIFQNINKTCIARGERGGGGRKGNEERGHTTENDTR